MALNFNNNYNKTDNNNISANDGMGHMNFKLVFLMTEAEEKKTRYIYHYPIPTPCFVAPHPMSPFNNR